jgi:hypothetical protein
MKIFSLLFALAIALPLSAAPFIPASETQILEQLPAKNVPANNEFKTLKNSLAQNPNDLSLALKTARHYIETGRKALCRLRASRARAVVESRRCTC